MLRQLCPLLLLVLPILQPQDATPSRSSQVGSAPNPAAEPDSALAWFRRADQVTDIRMPGSAPFQMKVTFHAYPGIDFAPKGKSTIAIGDGTYEETWLSHEAWRREVNFGAYHAVEVRAGGVRKFQASSDYEPSRVLMMLRALLVPVPRIFLEPQLDETPLHWKVQHLAAGSMQYVQVSLTQRLWNNAHTDTIASDFLPAGILVRTKDIYGLTTSWQDGQVFGSHWVPRRFTVQGLGNDLVTAEVTIQPVEPDAAPIEQIPGLPAGAGQTVRPIDSFLDRYQVKTFPWQTAPGLQVEEVIRGSDPDVPQGGYVGVIAVIDRNGIAHEAEWADIEKVQRLIGSHGPGDMDPYINDARLLVNVAWGKSKFPPPTIDGEPCEVRSELAIIQGETQFSGMR